jgi:hypothetical protein
VLKIESETRAINKQQKHTPVDRSIVEFLHQKEKLRNRQKIGSHFDNFAHCNLFGVAEVDKENEDRWVRNLDHFGSIQFVIIRRQTCKSQTELVARNALSSTRVQNLLTTSEIGSDVTSEQHNKQRTRQ